MKGLGSSMATVARTHVGVDRVDRHRLYFHKYLRGSRFGLREVAKTNVFGRPDLLDVSGFHVRSLLAGDEDVLEDQ